MHPLPRYSAIYPPSHRPIHRTPRSFSLPPSAGLHFPSSSSTMAASTPKQSAANPATAEGFNYPPVTPANESSFETDFKCHNCEACEAVEYPRISSRRNLWPPSYSHEVGLLLLRAQSNDEEPEEGQEAAALVVKKNGPSPAGELPMNTRCGENMRDYNKPHREDGIQCCKCDWNTKVSFEKKGWDVQKTKLDKCSFRECLHEFCDDCIIHRRLLCWVSLRSFSHDAGDEDMDIDGWL